MTNKLSPTLIECSNETQKVIRDAVNILKNGYMPCGENNAEDEMVTSVRNLDDASTIGFSSYLCAKGFLLQQKFHEAMNELIQNIDGVSFSPGNHKGNKRYMAKMFEYKNEGEAALEKYFNGIFNDYCVANNGDTPPDLEEKERSLAPKPWYKAIKDTVRGSVVCSNHSTMHAAFTALMSSNIFQGRVTKDRRTNDSCRDVCCR